MSREILEDIVNDFSPGKFSRFFREKNRSFSPKQEEFGHYDDQDFKGGIKLGEIKFTPAEHMIVCAFKAGQSLTERSGKKAQYEKGKQILKETQSDAGIFIFYDTQGNFRFSLIYDIPKEKGRRDWSNFRRFTYFVSREFTNKTFLQRIGDFDLSALDKIKDAFSVEKVTKEFYEQYRKLFEVLVADLNKNRVFQMVAEKNQINTTDFAKKLLGQIVFLYFLQKKGWLGVPQNKSWGEGDKNFVTNLFMQAAASKENFYNGYLEILFYDTLNNSRREGADPSFSKHFNCRIPFLNGGLFEAEYDWQGTKICLENAIFGNILETFDRFNFTVEEDSPDDKEVAVDPEMLGKVFENLLEENMRKGRGTYYTPREIVHYMCQESLVNYLKTASGLDDKTVRALVIEKSADKLTSEDSKKLDDLLAYIKVCDPACGSGAFLVGILHEIMSARLILSPGAGEYGLKKEAIQNCIYGVDIDPGAVEIAKLRLWLSLVVDYELAGIEPLPNLDYKVMCGNSLLEELIVGDQTIKLFDERLLNVKNGRKDQLFEIAGEGETFKSGRREQLQKLLKEKQVHFLKNHSQMTVESRREMEREFAAINKELNHRIKKSKNLDAHPSLFQEKAGHYFGVLRDLHKRYFNEYDADKKKVIRDRIADIEFEFIKSSIDEKVGDIEDQIRNLNMQIPEDRKKQAGLMKKKLEYLAIPGEIHHAKARPYFLWHLNFFEVFQEKGGFDVVIANPPYLVLSADFPNLDFFEKHYYVSRGGKKNLYKLFFERGLTLLRRNGALSFISPNNYLTSADSVALRDLLVQETCIQEIIEHSESDKVFDAVTQAVCTIVLVKCSIRNTKISYLKNGTQTFIDQNKILKHPLRFIKNLSPITEKMERQNYRVTDFVVGFQGEINVSTKKEYFTNKQRSSKHLPLVRGNQVKRYYTVNFPNGYCSTKVQSRDHHEQERVVFQEVCNAAVGRRISGTLLSNVLCGHTTNYLLSKSSKVSNKFLLALLNSRLINFYFKFYNQTNHVPIGEIKQIPLPDLLSLEQKRVVAFVDRILAAKRRDPEADTSALEREIDQMVYKLYGLTDEEIKIVDAVGGKVQGSAR